MADSNNKNIKKIPAPIQKTVFQYLTSGRYITTSSQRKPDAWIERHFKKEWIERIYKHKEKNMQYPIGSMPVYLEGMNVYESIEGQHRTVGILTTLSVLRDIFDSNLDSNITMTDKQRTELSQCSSQIKSLLQDPFSGKPRFIVSEDYNVIFKEIISVNKKYDKRRKFFEKNKKSNLVKGYGYIHSFLKNKGISDLIEFYEYFLYNVVMNVTVYNEADKYVKHCVNYNENNTGAPQKTFEKVKNLIVSETSFKVPDDSGVLSEVEKMVDTLFYDILDGLEKDHFLTFWVSEKEHRNISNSNLMEKFESELSPYCKKIDKTTGEPIISFLSELQHCANVYRSFYKDGERGEYYTHSPKIDKLIRECNELTSENRSKKVLSPFILPYSLILQNVSEDCVILSLKYIKEYIIRATTCDCNVYSSFTHFSKLTDLSGFEKSGFLTMYDYLKDRLDNLFIKEASTKSPKIVTDTNFESSLTEKTFDVRKVSSLNNLKKNEVVLNVFDVFDDSELNNNMKTSKKLGITNSVASFFVCNKRSNYDPKQQILKELKISSPRELTHDVIDKRLKNLIVKYKDSHKYQNIKK